MAKFRIRERVSVIKTEKYTGQDASNWSLKKSSNLRIIADWSQNEIFVTDQKVNRKFTYFFFANPSERLLAKRFAIARFASPLHFLSSAIATWNRSALAQEYYVDVNKSDPMNLETSLVNPIFTMLATSDSLKVSAEAGWGVAEAAAGAPELPGFDSLVSMLWSEADLRTMMLTRARFTATIKSRPRKRLSQLFVLKASCFFGRSFQSCRLSFITCSSSWKPEERFGMKFWTLKLTVWVYQNIVQCFP